MCAAFVEALMGHILEGMMIPKVQIERAIGPILSMFLEDVLTETLREDAVLSGPIAMICPEFPFKKPDNRQSTNIDWLMYNPARGQLIFLELKTADTSADAEQSAIYRAKQEAIRRDGGSFLITDLKELRDASGEHGKYSYILEHKVKPFEAAILACHDARIVYLVPESMRRKVQHQADRLLTFSTLSSSITGPFAEEWRAIQKCLCALDESSKHARNRQFRTTARAEGTTPWEGTLNFDGMFELCRERGDDVLIGFTGGRSAFMKKTLTELQTRRSYKWDFAANTAGKTLSDWLPGAEVIEMLKSHHQYSRN